ncbi:MAG TPA: Na+/H+ antiporter subunit E [Gemmatimonadaceae bacterium]|nr:Na+/H+ antiporter subunit E [Gemmatimonadaceae bacterium]
MSTGPHTGRRSRPGLARRLWALIALVGIFFRDLVASSLAVARITLAPYRLARPAIVVVPVDARTDWGVTLFACLVSMTPGSTCLHVADDRRSLYVHFLDAPDPAARAAEIKAVFEPRILELEGQEVVS